MVKKLDRNEFSSKVIPQLEKLCGSVTPDPFGATFSDQVECWRILYPYTYYPSNELMSLIKGCVNKCYGENGFYVKTIYSNLNSSEINCFSLTFDEFIEDHEQIMFAIVIENVIFSPTGQWGIVSSDEFHAVIGGSQEFINCLKKEIPDLDDQVYGFLELWAGYAEFYDLEIPWMTGFMYWMYGEEKGRQMLFENGLSFLYETRPWRLKWIKLRRKMKYIGRLYKNRLKRSFNNDRKHKRR